MKFDFFMGVDTLAELKALFKKLASKHHPDRGGDTAIMQEINAQYDVKMKSIIDGAGDEDYRDTNKTEGFYSFWESKAEHTEVEIKLKKAIDSILHLEGLIIEIIGVWVYVRGDTKQYKDILKENGFVFRSKKNKNDKKIVDCFWVFIGKPSSGRGTMTIEEMRSKYGSEGVGKRKVVEYS